MKFNLNAFIQECDLINLLLIATFISSIFFNTSILFIAILAYKAILAIVDAFKVTKVGDNVRINAEAKMEALEAKMSHLMNKDTAKEVFGQALRK